MMVRETSARAARRAGINVTVKRELPYKSQLTTRLMFCGAMAGYCWRRRLAAPLVGDTLISIPSTADVIRHEFQIRLFNNSIRNVHVRMVSLESSGPEFEDKVGVVPRAIPKSELIFNAAHSCYRAAKLFRNLSSSHPRLFPTR